MPAQPVIRAHEHWKIPFPIVDGPPNTLGWQWQSPGQATFVIITRGQTGSYKVVERFPLTAEGWAQAWQALTAADAAAAEQVATAVAARNAAASAHKQAQVPRDGPPVLVVTTNEVPGYRIIHVHGDVFGLIVRARNYFSNLGASFRTLAGGEVAGYTKLLTDSRNQARERMWRAARAKGANAVIAMRFRLQRDRRHHVRGGRLRDRRNHRAHPGNASIHPSGIASSAWSDGRAAYSPHSSRCGR